MGIPIQAEPVPLRVDEEGVVRVGGTRVTLDAVVTAFEEGATAEEIAQQYPSVGLADIYSVIGHYLRRMPEITEYLERRKQHRQALRAENEARFDPRGVRSRLLARRAKPT